MTSETSSKLAINTKRDLRSTLENNEALLREYLGEGVDIKHYLCGIIEEFDNNHALYSCSPQSIMQSLRKAAHTRLPLGQELCYFVPYAKECKFMISYKGLLHLAREAGAIKRHVVKAVFEGDQFDYDAGLYPSVIHRELALSQDDAKLTHVYAHFLLPGNLQHLEVMTREKIVKAKSMSPTRGKDSPWNKHFVSMAKKSVIREAFKGDQIPISGELKKMVLSDDFNEVVDGEVVDPNAAVKQLIIDQGMDEGGLFDKHENTGD